MQAALSTGYRHIDTAAYGNEREVGEAVVKSGVDRSEIFLETKIWISDYGYEQTLHGFTGAGSDDAESIRTIRPAGRTRLALPHRPELR